ncbi:MAG: aquaporin [Blastopirellula sp.]|nr:MAG: aquaporin [Blastopirellula sp.]
MKPKPIVACCVAEVIGTFLLIFFGLGAVHTAVLVGGLAGLWQVAIVWGLAIMIAVYAVGPISGAHINPAITIGFSIWGLFPKNRILPYVGSQLLGAFLAAAMLFVMFSPHIQAKEEQLGVTRGEIGSIVTASCYGEYFPNPGGLTFEDNSPGEVVEENYKLASESVAFLTELLGTAILAMMVLAVTEPTHSGGPKNLAPVFIGLTVAALICVIAPITQACFNPARDFGPRLFAYFAGWGEIALPGPRPRPTGFLTVYIIAPIVGSIIGSGLYLKVLRPHVPDDSVEEE